MRKMPSLRFFAGVAIALVGVLFMTGSIKLKPVQDSTSFKTEPIQLEGFDPESLEESDPPKYIIIPDLDIYLNVKNARLINGYWEVFDDSAGWGEGSGLPGRPGNQVIFAHARKGLFGSLNKIKKDMKILVLTENKWYEYKVATIDEVYPGNTKYVKQSENEVLTLYTCSGFLDSKRLIVKAEPIKI
jgi:LPXTG-site transpeptidase (sortase) family protein